MERLVSSAALVALLLAFWLPVITHQSASDIRLPPHVRALHYDLQITTSVCEENPNFTFSGQVDIKVQVKIATSKIKIHSKDLKITLPDTSLTAVDSNNTILIVSQEIDEKYEFFVLQFDSPLCVDCLYVLHIRFEGVLSNRLKGYYRSQYTDKKSGKTKWLAVTQFQATEARRAFPCFDEPEQKATFKISLGHAKECKAISNMPLVNSYAILGQSNWVMDEFDTTKKMSTYLVAFVVSEFRCVQAHADDRIRVCARRDGLQQASLPLQVGPLSLKYFEKYFDVEYPLSKADMLAIPDFNAGAMENWGLITFRETYVLNDDKLSTMKDKYKVASIISHELAHQWFGNLVTLKWWSDLWLNEGFATFVAAMGVHNAFPQWNSKDVEAVEEFIAVFALDGLMSSHPIYANISHPKEIAELFDVISYKKGSLVLRMTRLFLGEEVFRQGVINYLKKYQYGNAESDDLYHELTEEAKKQSALSDDLTLRDIMDSWTLQKGYPVVTVRRENNALYLTQKQFIFYRSEATNTGSSCWYIPITYSTQSQRQFSDTKPSAWLRCDKPELALTNIVKDNEWYIINNQAAGIYKINYDLENWKVLSKTLHSRHFKDIDVMNRMQIVTDVMHFAWASDIDVEIALKLFTYLRRETEYLPWRVGFHHIAKLNKIFMHTVDYNSFTCWVRQLLKPSLGRMKTPQLDDFHASRHYDRLMYWACHVQYESCLTRTRAIYKLWMRGPDPSLNDTMPVYLRSTSTCIALKYGGEREWNFAWNYYLSTNVIAVKVEMLQALGCSGQAWILRRYLNRILEEDGIRKQDATHVFLSIIRNEIGHSIAKEFFMTRIVDLYKLLGPRNTFFPRWLKAIAEMMFTEKEYEVFRSFVTVNTKYLEGSEMAVQQSQETIIDNIRWYQHNSEKYVSAFKKYINRNDKKVC